MGIVKINDELHEEVRRAPEADQQTARHVRAQ